MTASQLALQLTGVSPARKSWRSVFFEGLRSERLPIKICVGLSLLVILCLWFDVSGIIRELFSIDARFVLLAIGVFVLQFALAYMRWAYILKRQNIPVGWRDALSIFGISTLANLFLVTSIAGVSVRAALLVRSGSGLTGALASVSAERLAAALGLALCGGIGLVFAFPLVKSALGSLPLFSTLGVVAAGAAVLAAACLLANRKFEAFREFFSQVWQAFSSLRALLLLAGSSMAVILLGFAGLALLAGGMGLTINPVFFVSIMPVVALISALPISFGGWGVREGSMVAGLALFSVPAESAVALSVSYGLAGMFVAVIFGAGAALMGECRKAAVATH